MNIAISPIKYSYFAPIKKQVTSKPVNFCGRRKSSKGSSIELLMQAYIEKTKQDERLFYRDFCEKPKSVTLDEYFEIKDKHISCICSARKDLDDFYFGEITPENAAKMSLNVKRNLDEKHGENQYRIISIGTSPTPITQTLSYLGIEVTHFPVSGLQYSDYKEDERKSKILVELLKRRKLDDKKVNILTDFTYSGSSLNKTYQLIKDNFKNINLYPIPIQTLLIETLDIENPDIKLYNTFISDMKNSLCTEISNVPHFYIKDKTIDLDLKNEIKLKNSTDDEILEQFENYSCKEARLFELCTLFSLDKMGALKK